MSYLDETTKNALSSEYVLGSLNGRARIRYQRLMIEHDAIRKNVWRWESKLNQLGASLPELAPEDAVWEKIQRRLGFVDSSATSATEPWWKSIFVMPVTALATLVLALALIWPQLQPNVPSYEQVAVVQSADAETLWLIEIGSETLKIKATNTVVQYTDKDYELWIVAADGRAPISLGLIPKQGEVSIPRSSEFDALEIAALAVSLEPLGGSPNGQPTEVLYATKIVTM